MEWCGAAATFTTTTASTVSIWLQLATFVRGTQPEAREALALSEDGPIRRGFLTGLQGEIAKRGTIEVLRNGIKAQRALDIGLFINCHGGRTSRPPTAAGDERGQHGEVAIQGSTGRNVLRLCWTTGPIAVQSGRRRSLQWETG